MDVRVVDPARIDGSLIAEAAAILQRGGLVVFPTETVYGLGADATNAAAVSRIFAAKGRPSYNPLIVHVHDVSAAARCVTLWPDMARDLATRFWPGPLTLVLPKHPIIHDVVSAGLTSVGIRVPAHPVALALLRAANRPVAAPSANRSTQVSPTEGRHASASLGMTPDLLLDAGPASVGIESTVLDLTASIPTILRPGMISRSEIAAVVGEVRLGGRYADGEARPSPGMMDRHYSPRARLVVATDESARTIDEAVARETRAGRRTVVMARSDYQSRLCAVRQMPVDAGDYARSLYAMLHRLDADGFEAIVVEPLPAGDEWEAVRDRLRRASDPSSGFSRG